MRDRYIEKFWTSVVGEHPLIYLVQSFLSLSLFFYQLIKELTIHFHLLSLLLILIRKTN